MKSRGHSKDLLCANYYNSWVCCDVTRLPLQQQQQQHVWWREVTKQLYNRNYTRTYKHTYTFTATSTTTMWWRGHTDSLNNYTAGITHMMRGHNSNSDLRSHSNLCNKNETGHTHTHAHTLTQQQWEERPQAKTSTRSYKVKNTHTFSITKIWMRSQYQQ